MKNTEQIEWKNKVAQDYIEKLSNEDTFLELKKIDKNLAIFKKNVEEGFLTKKTKEALQDFLVTENFFEGIGDDIFKKNFSTISLLSQNLKKKINLAKKIINDPKKTEQEVRQELGLTTKEIIGKKNNNKTKIDNITLGDLNIDVKKYDKNTVKMVISDLQKQGINNIFVIKAILSTIAKESGFNPKVSEISYKNTSNGRIRRIFGSRVKGLSNKELNRLKANDLAFWDRVYGPDDPTGLSQKYGNTEPGDGLKYRGRGFNGLTFKSNYKKYGEMIGEDLVSNPDLLNQKDIASKVNAAYFVDQLKKTYTKNKYHYNNINDIDSFDKALDIVVNINAGIGKDINNENLQKNRDKALVASQNFELKNVV